MAAGLLVNLEFWRLLLVPLGGSSLASYLNTVVGFLGVKKKEQDIRLQRIENLKEEMLKVGY